MSDSDVSTSSSPVKSTHNSPLKQDFEERCKEVIRTRSRLFPSQPYTPRGAPTPSGGDE